MKTLKIYLAAGATLLGACTKEPLQTTPAGNDETVELVPLEPQIMVGDTTLINDHDTRLPFYSSTFGYDINYYYPQNYDNTKNWHEIGFSISGAGAPATPHMAGYGNIYARLVPADPVGANSTYNKWNIQLQDGNYYQKIPLYKNRGNVDFYAYYPYNQNVTDITAIPFDAQAIHPHVSTISAANDYMWYAKTGIDPTQAAHLTQGAQFKHAMTCIHIYFMLNTVGYVHVRHVEIETVDGGSWIPLAGTYNATNGAVTTTSYGNKLRMNTRGYAYGYRYGSSLSTGSDQCNFAFVIPEIAAASTTTDSKLRLTLYFNRDDLDTTPQLSEPYIIDLSKLSTASGTGGNYGLRTGYKYYFYARCDDFVKFVEIEQMAVIPWGSENINIKI
jgi:hypothetical protein